MKSKLRSCASILALSSFAGLATFVFACDKPADGAQPAASASATNGDISPMANEQDRKKGRERGGDGGGGGREREEHR